MHRKRCECVNASRRSAEAQGHVQSTVDYLLRAGRDLTLDDCEGVQWVFTNVSRSLRATAFQMRLKYNYLWSVPWIVVNADIPEVALYFEKANAIPPSFSW